MELTFGKGWRTERTGARAAAVAAAAAARAQREALDAADAADAAAQPDRQSDLTPARLARLGRLTVLSPHPDDESLGCGGLIATACALGLPVSAVLVTDGAMSHPGSMAFDAPARCALRVAEWRAALGALGVSSARQVRLGLPDGDLPAAGTARFTAAVAQLRCVLAQTAPDTLVVPWRRDAHADHRATWALAMAALDDSAAPLRRRPRVLEYAIWWPDAPLQTDVGNAAQALRLWRLDIAGMAARKRRAIACHRSQLGQVIHDDPVGFTLPREVLDRAAARYEYFWESAAFADGGAR